MTTVYAGTYATRDVDAIVTRNADGLLVRKDTFVDERRAEQAPAAAAWSSRRCSTRGGGPTRVTSTPRADRKVAP